MTYASRVSRNPFERATYELSGQAAVKHGDRHLLNFLGIFSGVLICVALMSVSLSLGLVCSTADPYSSDLSS